MPVARIWSDDGATALIARLHLSLGVVLSVFAISAAAAPDSDGVSWFLKEEPFRQGPIEADQIDAYRQGLRDGGERLVRESTVPEVRANILRELALSVGIQGALHAYSARVRGIYERRQKLMDKIFDFAPLMVRDRGNRLMVPPVVSERFDSLQTGASGTTMRAVRASYRVEVPQRFAVSPPTWRDYLFNYFESPGRPPKELMPRDSDERWVWDVAFDEGWGIGTEQASRIHEIQLNKLRADYIGMVRYHLLADRGYIKGAEFEVAAYPVTGGGEHMSIDDQVLTITAPAKLDPEVRNWRPIPQLPATNWLNLDYAAAPVGPAQDVFGGAFTAVEESGPRGDGRQQSRVLP